MKTPENINELNNKISTTKSSNRFKSIFRIFNFSIHQKIEEYNFYFNKIDNFNKEDYKILETVLSEYSAALGETSTHSYSARKVIDKDRVMFDVNFWLDGYFFTAMSLLDTIAHQVDHLYKVYPKWSSIFIDKIRKNLESKNKQWKINKILRKIEAKNSWYRSFKEYRNTITHESVISRELPIKYIASDQEEDLKTIYLPAQPKILPPKIIEQSRFEMSNLIKNYDKRLEILVNDIYISILEDTKKTKKLPL